MDLQRRLNVLESLLKNDKARDQISEQDKKDQQKEQAKGRIQAQQGQLLERFCKSRARINSIRAAPSSAIAKKGSYSEPLQQGSRSWVQSTGACQKELSSRQKAQTFLQAVTKAAGAPLVLIVDSLQTQ